MYSPIQTDLIVAVRDQGYMFVTGPDVIKDVTGEDSLDELGGADAQARYGNIHTVVDSEKDAMAYVRDYLGFLPSNAFDDPPIVNPGLEPEVTPHDLELDTIVPDADNTAYDMHEILLRIFDDGDFLGWPGRLGRRSSPATHGWTAARSASSPTSRCMSGAIDNEASDKAARFVRFCDSFNVPLVFVVDTPGFLPGVEQEKNGIIKRGGRFLLLRRRGRRAEGDHHGAQVLRRRVPGLGSKQLTSDFNFLWPTARIAVIRRRGCSAAHRQALPGSHRPPRCRIRRQFIEGYNRDMATPYVAAEQRRRGHRAARDPAQTPQRDAPVAGQADPARPAQAASSI